MNPAPTRGWPRTALLLHLLLRRSLVDWFRVYDSIIDDPKVLQLSLEFRWYYVGLLAISSRQSERGSLPSERQIAIHLRVRSKTVTRMVEFFLSSGFLEQDVNTKQLRIHGWERRQPKSDDVTERTRRFKERERERSGERSEERNGNVERALTERSVSAQKGAPLDAPSFPPLTLPLLSPPLIPPTKKSPGEPAFILPDSINGNDWLDYEEMRRKIRKPMSNRARQLAVAKLQELQRSGHAPSAVLQQSILHSWQGLFPIQSQRNGHAAAKAAHAPSDPAPDPRSQEQRDADERKYQELIASRKAKA